MGSIEKAYLQFLIDISEAGAGSLYGIDAMRTDLHKQLLKSHGYDESCYERSKRVLDHLDIAIDFCPPLTKWESVKVYAWELERLLSCQECQYFIEGRGIMLRTKYGVIKDD